MKLLKLLCNLYFQTFKPRVIIRKVPPFYLSVCDTKLHVATNIKNDAGHIPARLLSESEVINFDKYFSLSMLNSNIFSYLCSP